MGLTHTVSGDVAHFRTPSRVPIKSLKLHFLPKQEGSGDPSPTNVRPIIGWTGCNLKKCHKNIIKPYYSVATVKNGLTITPTTNGIRISGTAESRTACFICTTDNIKLGVGDKVAFSLYVNGDISECENPFLGYYKSTGVCGGVIYSFSSSNNRSHTIWTVPDTYTDISYIDSYIYIPQGVMVNFEIGLQGIISLYYSDDYEPYSGEQIPITFPSNGKNRYHYDENNIELGLPTEAGLIRTVVHTGVYGNGENISISATAIDPEMVSDNSFNVGYIKDGVIHVLKSFISWIDGSVTNGTVIVPRGYEFVIIATTDSKWAVTRNIPRYNIQIEYSDAPTSYEPYLSDNTFYGGYIDPVAGEIVAEFKIYTFNGEETIRDYPGSFTDGIRLVSEEFDDCTGAGQLTKCDKAPLEKTVPSTITRLGIRIGGGIGRFYFYIPDSMFDGEATVEKFKEWLSENNMTVVAKLTTPIHIPIAPQTMKAYLDHNNFWSDANDITEVSYEVTESKDIQAARKRFEAEEDGHHKLVRWNQVAHDGNFTNANLWYVNSNYGSLSASNNVITWTCTTQPTQFYHTGFVRDSIRYTNIPWNHKVLVRAMIRCSIPTLVRLYAMVGDGGYTHTYFYGKNIHANEWTELFGFVSDRPEIPPAGVNALPILRFKPCIFGTGNDLTTVTVGTTLEAKDMVAYDLTQMFGLGNEPTTVAEFERICALNGIDLTTYQPYDSGSDRWLIVP